MDGSVALSIVVPAYNEALRLPSALERMRFHFNSLGEEYEVIVVDDGSDDGTAERVELVAQNWSELSIIRLLVNAGKGAAVREGMLRARGRERAFTDADLSTPLEELARLRARLGGDCHAAIASRGLPDSTIELRQPRARQFAGQTYNRLVRLLVLPGIRDTQCGLKVFTDTAAVTCFTPLRTMRFGFDAEVLARMRRQGWSIAEVPVHWRHAEASRVSAGRDAPRMLLDLLRLRFGLFETEATGSEPALERAQSVSER